MAKPPKPSEDPLVAAAFDPARQGDLARAVAELSPDEAQFFLTKLEAALKKRRLQLTGYIAAALIWLVAMIGAFIYDGMTEGFIGWAYLVPFAIVGLVLWVFGRWSERVGSVNLPTPPATSKAGKKPKAV